MKNINLFGEAAPLMNYTSPETEQKYRDDSRLNQSKLKDMIKEGPKVLWAENESKTPTTAQLVGLIADMECTWTPGSVDEHFATLDAQPPSDTLTAICNFVVEEAVTTGMDVYDTELIIAGCDEMEYGSKWKKETRINKVLECSEYIEALQNAHGKVVVGNDEMSRGMAAAMSLKTHAATSFLFENKAKNKRYYYQVPIFGDVMGVDCKGLLDIVVIDFDAKTIHIYDVKTMAGATDIFQFSARQWRYDFQAAFYMALVNNIKPEGWTMKFSFAVESSTIPGIPLIYHTADSFIKGGYVGRKALTTTFNNDEYVVQKEVLGVQQAIALYKDYMTRPGEERRKTIIDNNHNLNLEWNYTTY